MTSLFVVLRNQLMHVTGLEQGVARSALREGLL